MSVAARIGDRSRYLQMLDIAGVAASLLRDLPIGVITRKGNAPGRARPLHGDGKHDGRFTSNEANQP